MKKLFFFTAITLLNYAGFAKESSYHISINNDSTNANNSRSEVKYVSFDATLKGKTVTCSWVTEQEINHNYFELESSYDGVNYKAAALVFGAEGNSNVKLTYQFTDKNIALKRNDIVYYRLKQIGNDSIVKFTKSIKVHLTEDASTVLGVVPNPFANNITYNIQAPTSGYVITKILNLGGRLMTTKHNAVVKGTNSLQLNDLNEFTSGVYIMEVIMNGSVIGRQKINKV